MLTQCQHGYWLRGHTNFELNDQISSQKQKKLWNRFACSYGNLLIVFLSKSLVFCKKMSELVISLKNWAICSFWWVTWANQSQSLIFGEQPKQFAHSCSFVMSNLADLLTSLFKKEGMSESLVEKKKLCRLSLISCLTVSCLLYHVVSCLMSHISCLNLIRVSQVSHLASLFSCLTSPVSLLLSPVSCLLSHISCLRSHISFLTSPASCLLFHFSCQSPVFCWFNSWRRKNSQQISWHCHFKAVLRIRIYYYAEPDHGPHFCLYGSWSRIQIQGGQK